MKDLWQNNATLKFIVFLALIIGVPISFFLGIRYLAPIVIIVLVYLFIHRFTYEEIISPKEFNEMNVYLRELEERASIIQEHLEYHDADLDAKFELLEINKEIELVKKEMGL